jgi:hypothetical protein
VELPRGCYSTPALLKYEADINASLSYYCRKVNRGKFAVPD